MLKAGDDKIAIQAWSSLLGLALALPLVAWVGAPEPAIVPWLLGGWVLHSVYYVVLIKSYSISDYSLAYPIARGIVPIGTTALGMIWLGDRLDIVAIAGVATICAGLVLLGRPGSMTRNGMLLAVTVGLINVAFTLVDAKGLRVADNLFNFLVWYFVLDGISMPALFMMRNRGGLRDAAAASLRHGLKTGAMALMAYLPALIAYRLAPVGAVSAIRATSVLFGIGIAGALLREALDYRRIAGALLVTAGACAIIAGSTGG